MDVYPLILVLHIAFVALWVGGGATMVILGTLAETAKDYSELGRVIRNLAFIGPRVFALASIGALICGLILMWLRWNFTDLWVLLGILGFLASAITGGRFLRPKTERVLAAMDQGSLTGPPLAEARRILQIARFDSVLMLVLIADMVLKPALLDYWTLIIMALVLAAAGFYFLARKQPE